MTLKNGFSKCSLFVLSPVDEKIKTGTPHFKAKYQLICRKFSGMKFFQLSISSTNQKPRVFVLI